MRMKKILCIIVLKETRLVYLTTSRYSTIFTQFLTISARIFTLLYTTFLSLKKKRYLKQSIYCPLGEERNEEKIIQEKKDIRIYGEKN